MQQLLRYKHFTCRDVEDTGDGFGASAWVHPNPVDLVLLHPKLGIVPAVIMLGLAVLLGFYFWHYFFLENTVQRWYRIAEEMPGKRKEG